DGIRDYKVTGVQTCALPISDATCGPVVAYPGSRRRATRSMACAPQARAPRAERRSLLRGFGLAVPVAHTGRGKAHGECGAVATCPAIRARLLGVARDQHRRWHRLAAELVSVAIRPARAPAPHPRPRASDGGARSRAGGGERSRRHRGLLPCRRTRGD